MQDATVQRKSENEEFTELMSSNTAAKERGQNGSWMLSFSELT